MYTWTLTGSVITVTADSFPRQEFATDINFLLHTDEFRRQTVSTEVTLRNDVTGETSTSVGHLISRVKAGRYTFSVDGYTSYVPGQLIFVTPDLGPFTNRGHVPLRLIYVPPPPPPPTPLPPTDVSLPDVPLSPLSPVDPYVPPVEGPPPIPPNEPPVEEPPILPVEEPPVEESDEDSVSVPDEPPVEEPYGPPVPTPQSSPSQPKTNDGFLAILILLLVMLGIGTVGVMFKMQAARRHRL